LKKAKEIKKSKVLV